MARPIIVLYEDELAKGSRVTNYGPHVLVCSCIADLLEMTSPWALKPYFAPYACKGHSKLLQHAREKLLISSPVYLLLDTDRPPPQLGLPRNATASALAAAVRGHFPDEAGIRPFGLERNLETLVGAAAGALGHARPSRKPRPEERDAWLIELARAPRLQRDQLLSEVPSLRDFVEALKVEVEATLVCDALVADPDDEQA